MFQCGTDYAGNRFLLGKPLGQRRGSDFLPIRRVAIRYDHHFGLCNVKLFLSNHPVCQQPQAHNLEAELGIGQNPSPKGGTSDVSISSSVSALTFAQSVAVSFFKSLTLMLWRIFTFPDRV